MEQNRNTSVCFFEHLQGCLRCVLVTHRSSGPAKMSEQEAAAVRADSPMPPQCGLFYFEITVIAKGKEG